MQKLLPPLHLHLSQKSAHFASTGLGRERIKKEKLGAIWEAWATETLKTSKSLQLFLFFIHQKRKSNAPLPGFDENSSQAFGHGFTNYYSIATSIHIREWKRHCCYYLQLLMRGCILMLIMWFCNLQTWKCIKIAEKTWLLPLFIDLYHGCLLSQGHDRASWRPSQRQLTLPALPSLLAETTHCFNWIGVFVLFQGKFLIENVSKGVIVGNQTLALQKVTREDAGLYTCVASNSEGDGESNAQYLDIKCSFQLPSALYTWISFLISVTVAPECKQNQRIVYGAAFKSEIMVNCYVEANPMPHSFKWQFKTASKRRRTDLINTVGGAKALDEIKDMVDLPSNQYSLEYDHSLLRYRTMTEADYGYLYCWAENLAGPQREPCRFEVVRESPPDPPIYCQPLNVTWEHIEVGQFSLIYQETRFQFCQFQVTCQPGFDGGHLPTYHCEVFTNHELAFNLSSQEAPSFGLTNLEAGADYHVVVYASNDLGSSPKVAFNASTLNLAEKRTAETRSKLSPIMNDPKELDVQDHIKVDPGLALLPIVAILCGVAIGLGTVALGVILMVRGRHAGGAADRNEDGGLGDLASGDEASIKRYDAVCATSSTASSSEVDLRPQSTVVVGHHHHAGSAAGKEHRFRGVPAGKRLNSAESIFGLDHQARKKIPASSVPLLVNNGQEPVSNSSVDKKSCSV